MATQSCPACGITVAHDATECPDCGHAIANTISATAIVIVVLLVAGAVVTALLLASWGGPSSIGPGG